ncbi:hypothetical protein LTR85_011200 [Meristemomyces frigidus]|nr:hypothetical protein LTR85_011200 [Meristemomyces frigidus]
MDTDPWSWDTSDVQQFFRQDAIRFIADRPSGQLPPLNAFAQALGDNDVDGASLLDSIEIPALRDDFGMYSYRHNGTIMHCIRKLRSLSLTYQSRNASLAPQTPRSMVAIPLPPSASAGLAEILPSTEAVGENVREGEVHVEDAHGRKRRKLDLTTTEAVPQPAYAGKTREDAGSYLPDAPLPIDEIFYGPTGLGHVIGELHPDGSVLVDHHDPDTADDNFQFTSQQKRDGEVHFVYSRMQYLLRNSEQVSVRRRGRNAVAVLPYRDGQQLKARSATVIQASKDDEYVAIKEQASLLQSGYDYTGQNQESTGEWDWVLQKHKQKEGEDEISIWGDSEHGDDVGTVATTDGDEDKGPEADEEDDQGALFRPRIEELVDTELEKYTAKCQGKILALEEKRAWSVWKQTKQSRGERDRLIHGANARIADFTRRLGRLREDLLDREYSSEQSVQRACANLEPTIEDREMDRWKISVWVRRDEPAHTVIHRAKQNGTTLQTPATGNATAAFVVHPEDRLSISPTPAMHVHADGGAAAALDDDNDEFHSANVSPVGSPPPDLDGSEASDEMSEDQDQDEQRPSSDLPQAGGLLDEFTSSPPAHSRSSELPIAELSDVDMSDAETPVKSFLCPTCALHRTTTEEEMDVHLDDCLSADLIKDATNEDAASADSEDELPDASTFVSQTTKRLPETPGKSSKAGPSRAATQPIDLTLSSDSPGAASSQTPRKGKGKGKAPSKKHPPLNGLPEQATSAEVDLWEWAYLSKNADRHRIVIKIFREMEPDQREALHQCLLKAGTRNERIDQLQAAAKAYETGDPEGAGLNADHADHMMHLARIAAAWWLSDHTFYFETDHEDAPWKALYNDKAQVGFFHDKLIALLKIKESRLFSGPRAKRSDGVAKTSDITIISDSGEESHRTPHKQRKNKVKESQSAKKSRTAALARYAQYTQQMESQTTDSSKLVAMIASDPSNSEIEINPIRADGYDPIYIHPNIARKMKPHQIDGVRFLWREITWPGDEGAQGCLLAHTMGLGKTMQTITLLVALVEASESRSSGVRKQLPAHLRRPKDHQDKRQLRILILCPPSLLQNWQREIEQWAPKKRIGNIFTVTSGKDPQIKEIEGWYKVGGVLLMGYSLFRGFIIRKEGKRSSDVASKLDKMLLEGPEVVVADEAHNLKNTKAGISQAANAVNTQTRIALTGTPMSNDVQEIYALVSWVAPGYLGEPQEFRANYGEPIAQGTYEDSTRYEKRKSVMKLTVLHDQIKPKVNRADITVLRGSLKPKVEFVITVPLTELQQTVYKRYVAALLGGGKNAKASQVTIFSWLAVLGLLTNHPSAFRRKLLTKPVPKKPRKGSVRGASPSDDGSNATTAVEVETTAEQLLEAEAEGGEAGEAYGEQDVYALGFTEDMVQEILRGVDDDMDSALSAKTTMVLDILQLSQKCGDKLLVFSGSIPTLQYLSELLNAKNIGHGRIDGTVLMPKRMQLIEDFHRGRFEVLLVSTKAGGVGLNIQSANRVIIMDFGFNPSWEEQAIGRAYRLGQTKAVFVYRLLAGGTFETNLWNKQLFKTSLTNRVVDKKNTRRNAQRNTREYLHQPAEVPQEDLSKWIGKDPLVLDKMLMQHEKADSMIRTILTTETLQEEVQEEALNEEERLEVAQEIAQGKTRRGGRKSATQNGYVAAKGSVGPVHPPAPAQALRTQPHVHRPSGSQATPARLIHSTAPAAAAAARGQQSPIGGLPIHRPAPQGQQRSHGHPPH